MTSFGSSCFTSTHAIQHHNHIKRLLLSCGLCTCSDLQFCDTIVSCWRITCLMEIPSHNQALLRDILGHNRNHNAHTLLNNNHIECMYIPGKRQLSQATFKHHQIPICTPWIPKDMPECFASHVSRRVWYANGLKAMVFVVSLKCIHHTCRCRSTRTKHHTNAGKKAMSENGWSGWYLIALPDPERSAKRLP